MKKFILPAVIVLVGMAAALSMGAFTGGTQSAVVSDDVKECGRTAVVASGAQCGDKAVKVAASSKQCGDKVRATAASERKECGSVTTATKAATEIECPHSGAVLRASSEKESCGDKTTAVHASVEKTGKDEACCEEHAFASVD